MAQNVQLSPDPARQLIHSLRNSSHNLEFTLFRQHVSPVRHGRLRGGPVCSMVLASPERMQRARDPVLGRRFREPHAPPTSRPSMPGRTVVWLGDRTPCQASPLAGGPAFHQGPYYARHAPPLASQSCFGLLRRRTRVWPGQFAERCGPHVFLTQPTVESAPGAHPGGYGVPAKSVDFVGHPLPEFPIQ
jgi:hypothetical protein